LRAQRDESQIDPGLSPAEQWREGDAPLPVKVRVFGAGFEQFLFLEDLQSQPTFAKLQNAGLTKRQAEVLGWLAQGKSNEEIGFGLGLSPRTVKKHLERIYLVLQTKNRTAAALKAAALLRG
jgi:DNA-binding CsgD family transcriptional regulator